MQLVTLSRRGQLIYQLHKFLHTFQPFSRGSEVGMEFEDKLREYLVQNCSLDLISTRRDLSLGLGLASGSGLRHELDLIVRIDQNLFIFELKHYTQHKLNKEMALVFNQKVLDYYIENFKYLKPLKLYRIFITRSAEIDSQIRQFCTLWGVLLLDRELLSPPICQLILETIREDLERSPYRFTHKALLSQLTTLSQHATALGDKIWPDLNTLWTPQLTLPGQGFATHSNHQLPPAYVVRRWVNQQYELSRQTHALKARFANWHKEGRW